MNQYQNQQNPSNIGFQPYTGNNLEIVGTVIGNDREPLSANDIFQTVKVFYPDIFQTEQISDEFKLESFKRVLNGFAYPTANIRWNFLTEKLTIDLCAGQTKYTVPDNYDSMIAVWLDKDCGLCKNSRLEVEYRSLEKTNFEDDLNFWYKEGGDFVFSNLQLENKLASCNSCGECDSCHKFSGGVNLHYFTTARQPTNLDDRVEWLPKHPNVKDYLVLKVAEELKIMMGKEPMSAIHYQTMQDKYNSILHTEKYLYPTKNKSNNDFKFFNFNTIKNKFRI